MKTLLIIDGYSLAFRAYYAYPQSLTLPDGFVVNAIYGFITLFFSAIDQFNPTHVVVCFDRKEPTFRHKKYEAYKAHRPPAPEDFIEQMNRLKEALSDFGIQYIEKPGFEADDLMGTFANQYSSVCEKIYLYTGDHDAFQLVSDTVHVIMPKKGVSAFLIYSPKEVLERYHVTSDQIIDFKALKGDSSDNIPGVKGIGDKTASKLIQDHSSLKNIYENIDLISNAKLKEKLILGKENAFLSYDLAKIDVNVSLNFQLDTFLKQFDWAVIFNFFTQYRFKSLLKKYETNFNALDSVVACNEHYTHQSTHYVLVETLEECEQLIPKLLNGFSFDLETTSLIVQEAQIVGISISFEEGEAYYIALNKFVSKVQLSETVPMFNAGSEVTINRKLNPFLKCLKPIFEDASVEKFLHNAKYDYQVLFYYGICLKGVCFDTMIAAFLCDPYQKIGLKDVVYKVFNITMKSYEDVVGTGKSKCSFEDVEITTALEYAAADADMTFRLKNYFQSLLQEKKLDTLFYTIEMPLIFVLADMELNGVDIDIEKLNAIRSLFQAELDVLVKAIYHKTECEFNINSTKQVAEVLFDRLLLPVIKKTKTGRSTDMAVLEELKNEHPVIEDLIHYRILEKLLSTYVNSLPQLISPVTNKIHSHFNQAVAVTGRLSSTAPNLQNIPIRTSKGKEIRSIFISSSNKHFILAADYSQIELRLMAHLAQDKTMIDSFLSGEDIHALTASKVFNCELSAITKEQRYQAKAVNFGILYGMSASSLSKQINVSRKAASQMIADYFERFSNVNLFIKNTIENAKKNGFVKTEFGRIRPLLNINTANWATRQFEERVAVNTRLQGTAADIMKLAMISIDKEFKKSKLESKMIIQVHDELVFDVIDSEFDIIKNIIVSNMEHVVEYSVPLTVDLQFGKNWLDLNL